MNDLVIVLMGVSGCGKSTVGRVLAQLTNEQFIDGDDFHSAKNKAKMASGEPLTDDDRAGWLQNLTARMAAQGEKTLFVACSALKKSYRDTLRQAAGKKVRFVYLKGEKWLLESRLAKRANEESHFMSSALLASQLATLEEPENALVLDIRDSPEELAQKITRHFALRN